MSQRLSVNDFKWVEDISEINEYFIKNNDNESSEGYFLQADVQYQTID